MNKQYITIENGVIMDLVMPKDGTYEITKKKVTRRIKANDYYWACVTLVAKDTGTDKNEIHAWNKAEFLPVKYVTIKNETHCIISDSKNLSIAKFAIFTNKFLDKWGEYNFPDPDLFRLEKWNNFKK
jgi:hypothetical protein